MIYNIYHFGFNHLAKIAILLFFTVWQLLKMTAKVLTGLPDLLADDFDMTHDDEQKRLVFCRPCNEEYLIPEAEAACPICGNEDINADL